MFVSIVIIDGQRVEVLSGNMLVVGETAEGKVIGEKFKSYYSPDRKEVSGIITAIEDYEVWPND